jgi:SOS-response transcriptional repressor LexA
VAELETIGAFGLVRVTGDGAAPRIPPGTWLCVDEQREPLPGDVVVARRGGELLVKELHAWGGELWLTAVNGTVPQPVGPDVEILGVVRSVIPAP